MLTCPFKLFCFWNMSKVAAQFSPLQFVFPFANGNSGVSLMNGDVHVEVIEIFSKFHFNMVRNGACVEWLDYWVQLKFEQESIPGFSFCKRNASVILTYKQIESRCLVLFFHVLGLKLEFFYFSSGMSKCDLYCGVSEGNPTQWLEQGSSSQTDHCPSVRDYSKVINVIIANLISSCNNNNIITTFVMCVMSSSVPNRAH